MTDFNEPDVSRALAPYARELRQMHASESLDARMQASIDAWAGESAVRRMLRRPLPWVGVAASLAIISGGIALFVQRGGGDVRSQTGEAPRVSAEQPIVTLAPPAPLSAGTDVSALAAGQISMWPAESAIFRVKASVASAPGTAVSTSDRSTREKQYWVDVRIANDGTMRIMQVLPADRSHATP